MNFEILFADFTGIYCFDYRLQLGGIKGLMLKKAWEKVNAHTNSFIALEIDYCFSVISTIFVLL